MSADGAHIATLYPPTFYVTGLAYHLKFELPIVILMYLRCIIR